jgi:hypothetical protein
MIKQKVETQKVAITPQEAEEIYGIPAGTLANWRYRKMGPKYYRISRKIYYAVKDFDVWFYRNPVLTADSLPEAEK